MSIHHGNVGVSMGGSLVRTRQRKKRARCRSCASWNGKCTFKKSPREGQFCAQYEPNKSGPVIIIQPAKTEGTAAQTVAAPTAPKKTQERHFTIVFPPPGQRQNPEMKGWRKIGQEWHLQYADLWHGPKPPKDARRVTETQLVSLYRRGMTTGNLREFVRKEILESNKVSHLKEDSDGHPVDA